MPKPTPAELRQKAKAEGWSEDFARFDDATLQRWLGSHWDEKANRFKSEKVDAQGNPIQGFFEKPDECPEGTTAFGKNQCRPLNEVAEIQARQAGQAGGGAPGAPAPPPKPVTEGKPGDLTYTGNPMTDMLIGMFNSRRRLSDEAAPNLFGFKGGRDPGALDVTEAGTPKDPTANQPDISGRLLSGGGLYWTETPQAPTAPGAPAPPAAPGAPAPPAAPTAAPAAAAPPTAAAPTPPTFKPWGGAPKQPQTPLATNTLFGAPAQDPNAPTPLAGMLTQRKKQGAFGGLFGGA